MSEIGGGSVALIGVEDSDLDALDCVLDVLVERIDPLGLSESMRTRIMR